MAEAKRTLLAFGEGSLDTYKRLGTLLGGITNRSQFLIAMVWGYRYGLEAVDFKRSKTGPAVNSSRSLTRWGSSPSRR